MSFRQHIRHRVAAMSSPDVTVSIVMYNSKNVIEKCIRSVIETTKGIDIEIIIVDNSSEDGSDALVGSLFPQIQLIENVENVGFGTAHNQSFRLSRGKYFLILNPDTVVFPDAIKNMVQFMNNNKTAGITGCKIYWDNMKNFMFPDLRLHNLRTAIIQFSPYSLYFPDSGLCRWYRRKAYRAWRADTPLRVDGVTGGLMLVRREAFESVGGFDENFFLFFEEHDLQRRIEKQGWECYYLPHAEIQHLFEESFRNSSIDIDKVFIQSALYYYRKYYGTFGYLFIKALLALNKAMTSLKCSSVFQKNILTQISPVDGKLMVQWLPDKRAKEYLVEISYSPLFSDRAGLYVSDENLSLESDILNRLPNRIGFLRILPVYENNSTGRIMKIIKITD